MFYLLKQYFISVVVFGVTSFSSVLLADDAVIILKHTVSMTSNRVMLKDIADVEISDESVKTKLSNIYIMKSPRIGYVNNINVQQIKRIIARDIRVRSVSVVFSGADKVLIRSKGKEYEYKKLKELAGVALIKELGSDHREIKYSFSMTPEKINLPFGDLRFKTRFNSKIIRKKMCVWVDVYRKNSLYRSIPVWINLAVFESIYVASHFIERHSIVSDSDFVVLRKDIANLSGRYFSAGSFRHELLLKKTIRAGEALRSDNVKIVPAIIAGVVLDVTANEGAVSIKVKGVARKDAELGEVINVKSLQGGSILKTKVIGKQLVEVI